MGLKADGFLERYGRKESARYYKADGNRYISTYIIIGFCHRLFYGIWLILTGKGILEGIFLTIIFNTIIVVMLKARKRSVV